MTKSLKIYIGLVILLTVLAVVYVFMPLGGMLPTQSLPAPLWVLALVNGAVMLVLYGLLGLLGLNLGQKLGWAKIWDERITNKERFLTPFYWGLGLGVFFIIADMIFKRFSGFVFPHPPFPTSIVASFTAGIGEEILFRLFLVSFLAWLGKLIFKGKYQNIIFWVVSSFAALNFALGHLPSVMILLNLQSINQIPVITWIEVILLNSAMSLPAAYFLRKNGFLAAVGIHFWTDIIWHVIWGIV